ncbi:A-kinase anchor protein 8-like isoform X2 [Rhinatrema bivittatum]|uniref:A-kinase anchor protein 8-like isoform X2 n=1 Tax=Rhinatrema bivittatum TaxID=194408 RepID=UPI00112CAD9A|nr:A-kinase anchor protein 8-like isoform X2 [Rhinatrema bivittatum]
MDTRGYSGYEGYDYGYGYSQGDSGTTGNYGYDSYESYDSRSSLNDRDLYRSGYSYSEAGHDQDMTAYDGRYDSSYGNSRDQFQNRAWDNYGQQGQNWARDGRNKRSMASSYSGYMGGQWNEPLQSKGGRGPGASGSSRLPSLFSHSIVPEHKRFQGLRGFSGNFGVGAFKQQMRKNWKMWDGDKPQQKKKVKKDTVAGNKRKQTNTTDEPDSKVAKNETANSESENEGKEGEDAAETGTKAEGADEGNEKGESGSALTIQEEISQIKKKLQAGKKTQDRQKKRQRDRMVERIQFVCSLCKYRTFYEDEMTNHLDSRFHKDHFKFVGTKLPQQTADFLQDYVANKTKKTEERRKMVEDINAAIQQIFKDQDLTTDLPMEHFVKKVEAAHCTACDLFIPMQHGILQKHLRSIDHNHNRKVMMEQSKKSALIVARSILNNKMISKKLEKYLKGENPFTDDSLEKGNPEGEGGTEEAADESKGNEEVAEDEAAEDEQPEGTEEAFTTEEEEKQVEEDDEDQPMEEEENELAE